MLLFAAFQARSQQHLNSKPLGGSFMTEKTECVSPEERQRIQNMLKENIEGLKAAGILPGSCGAASNQQAKPTAGSFIWPLKQMPGGYGFNSYYGVSNYVDLNPVYPNQVLDWNCGSRTYDLSNGYNHGGIDIFLWPFAQQMQEQDMVAVIAAADGIIIGKDDGNFDKNCGMNNGSPWNAVYVGHTDGTISWYGHLKRNSLTEKQIGESVSSGDFLGIVGSSGSSTAPHLHFETHDGAGTVLEPYEGPCNNRPGLWINQKPYYEPTINALLTHHAPPEFPACPTLESPNLKDTFSAGDLITFAAYFHDQLNTGAVSYTILRPDGRVFDSWQHTADALHYSASYWYWSGIVGNDWQQGLWQWHAEYEGRSLSHAFYIQAPSSLPSAGRNAEDIRLYPNPSPGHFRIMGLTTSELPATFSVYDLSGKEMMVGTILSRAEAIKLPEFLTKGFYLLKITTAGGHHRTARFMLHP